MSGAAGAPRILLVDDSPAKLALIRRMLADSGAEIVGIGDSTRALEASRDGGFALFILDVNMPGLDGFQLAERLAEQPATRGTPIMFITGSGSHDAQHLRGYGSGAVDYLVDPVNPFVLRSKVRVFLDLHRTQQQLRAEVAERERQATHDVLTGLPNRLLFWDTLAQVTAQGRGAALLYIDIDGFKAVNDGHGHRAGDELLRQLAQRLREGVRERDFVARLGGDEFAVLLVSAQEREGALGAAGALVETLREPCRLEIEGQDPVEVQVGASIGVAVHPVHGTSVDALLRAADEAMYRAKRAGKNRCAVAG